MKLSIIMPSHNVGARINANILNVSSMGADDVEVIIRENSGNDEKRKFLSQVHEKNCRILTVDECPGEENAAQLMREAKGDFALFISDDDFTNSHAIASILEEIERIRNNPTIIGTTGLFVLDDASRTNFYCFDKFDTPDPVDRFKAYLGVGAPHVFQFSPLRLDVLRDVWSFASTLPIYMSYHDQLMNSMFLMHGRITYMQRFIYQYHNSNWSTPELCLKNDANYVRKAGLDPSSVRLQWLIAAFEGAQTFIRKYQRVKLPQDQRQALGSYWFSCRFHGFLNTLTRQAEGSQFDAQSISLAEKWRMKTEMNLDELLGDITAHYALSSPEIAQRYYNFWKTDSY